MISSRITGLGSYVPPRKVTNKDLEKMMDTSDEWILQRTGIHQRFWVDEDTTVGTSDLALEASRQAIQAAGIKTTDIEMIILATLSPDHEFPGTACFLQAKLELPGIPALDIRQQCTGFIYGLSIADQFIKTGVYKNILVVGAEVHSRGLDKTTAGRDVAVLFGDGAGAAVVSASNETGDKASKIYNTKLHADGRFAKELWIRAPGTADSGAWLSQEKIRAGYHHAQMSGKTVFVNAVKRMPEVVTQSISDAGFKMADVDLFVFHQANLRINEMVGKQLGVSEDKIFNTIQQFGNTTAATIPIGLHEAQKAGKLKPGMLVAIAAFGSGFTWAGALIRW